MLRVGIFAPAKLALSLSNYVTAIRRELARSSVEFIDFAEDEMKLPAADLYWDPRAAGGVPPYSALSESSKPVVATLHGVAPLALPGREYFPNLLSMIRGKFSNQRRFRGWRKFHGRCAAIITVSHFAKRDIEEHLNLHDEYIVPIHHGVDLDTFAPASVTQADTEPFLLHVAQYQPKKNVIRILAAYERISTASRPRLVLVVPGYTGHPAPEGVTVFRTPVSLTELAGLYRDALGFVFPSLHESFGMPILEAMASGCPVITSNGTGCAEVAGDAALLVDPRSVNAIAEAMRRIAEDAALRAALREKGLARAAQFTWRRCAQQHLAVFEEALRGDKAP